MEIKSVALLGAGAVGSYIIWGLSKLENIKFGIVAEGKRAQRLKRDGCLINNELYRPQVWSPEEARGADLLIVALKYGALPDALPAIRTIVDSNTTVMSLMNGVDSEDIIAQVIERKQILYSLIKIASHHEGRGVCFNPVSTMGIVFGEAEPPFDSERALAVEELMQKADIHIRRSDCIKEEIWAKFRLNVCNNLPQAVLGVGLGCYKDSIHMQAIQQGLRQELEAIAKAKGIDIDRCDKSSAHGSAVAPSARFSTLQDLDAGRHTEIDMFSGALMKMGQELGIPTPFNAYTYHIIKALEEKNDGLFDYTGKNEESTCSR